MQQTLTWRTTTDGHVHPAAPRRDHSRGLPGSTRLDRDSAAEWLGVSRQSLSELLNGHNGVSAEMAIRLERPGGAPHARGSEHKSPTILPRPDRRQSTSSPIRNPPHHNDGNHRQANIATRLILHKLRQVLHEQ